MTLDEEIDLFNAPAELDEDVHESEDVEEQKPTKKIETKKETKKSTETEKKSTTTKKKSKSDDEVEVTMNIAEMNRRRKLEEE